MAEFKIVENDNKSFENGMKDEMTKAIKHFEVELVKIRTGRAHTSLVEDIPVACYGAAPVPLKQLATLAAPETRLLTIQPWDTGIIPDIEKAITSSDVGVKPINDGRIIRLQLPEMSSSRRDELVKVLGKKEEEAKVAIRVIRQKFHNLMRDAKKNSAISENFYNRLEDCLQKVTDSFIKKIEEMAAKKEKDVRTV